jgi:asparaginyl-tRNA synthetase
MKSAIPIREALQSKYTGKNVTVRGWVYRKRSMKGKVFLVLRDSTDIIQAVVADNSRAWQSANDITIESSCYISGKLKKDDRAPTGYELIVSGVEIVGLAEIFPISRDTSTEFLMDVRHLSLRSRRMTAILRVRSTMLLAYHEYLHSINYTEAEAPTFNAATSEGGSSTFAVDYFGQKAFLSQSWQFYAENMIHVFEKIYALTPSFRAEKSSTNRHITEFWMLEVEAAWAGMPDILKIAEGCIVYAIKKILKENKRELEILGVDIDKLKKVKSPFPQMTYDAALKKLQKKGFKISYGQDLGAKEERELAKPYGVPVAVTNYPLQILKFYHGEDPKKLGTGLNFNILAPGLGEIVDGSQREPDLKKIISRLKRAKIDLGSSDWYLDSRRYGSVPHAGFGLGTERVLQWILDLEHIRDTLPFPRFMNRISP